MIISRSDRPRIIVGVHLVIFEGTKILLGKRQNTGWADGKFHLFGGHVEEMEFVSAALAREGREELGIEIDLHKAKLLHTRSILRPDHSRLHLYFQIHSWTGDIKNNEPENCSELQWFEINNLPENITQDSRESLQNILKGINYSETKSND